VKTFFWIAIAGSCGAMTRYLIYLLTNRLYQGSFPWATISVNLIGCLLFGLIYSLSEDRLTISNETRIIILVGFVAAFTTFSTFAFENAELIKSSEWLKLGLNMSIQNIAGILLVFLGMTLGRA
jgi:CrcB protein